MSRKEYILIGLVAVMAALYVVFFSDWFKPKFIRIEYAIRSSREAWGAAGRIETKNNASSGVSFALHQNYRLTSVRVVRSAEIQTNRYAHPLWNLVTEKGSTPVDGFAYGYSLQGMSPTVAGAEPEPLESGIDYLLLVEAGSLKGTNAFKLERRPNSSR